MSLSKLVTLLSLSLMKHRTIGMSVAYCTYNAVACNENKYVSTSTNSTLICFYATYVAIFLDLPELE